MEDWISPRKPFGIESSFSQTENFKKIADKLHNVKCLGKGFNVGYINFSQITAHQDWIEKIKIFMPYANNIGTELSDDNLNTFVDEGNMVCTEAYIWKIKILRRIWRIICRQNLQDLCTAWQRRASTQLQKLFALYLFKIFHSLGTIKNCTRNIICRLKK